MLLPNILYCHRLSGIYKALDFRASWIINSLSAGEEMDSAKRICPRSARFTTNPLMATKDGEVQVISSSKCDSVIGALDMFLSWILPSWSMVSQLGIDHNIEESTAMMETCVSNLVEYQISSASKKAIYEPVAKEIP